MKLILPVRCHSNTISISLLLFSMFLFTPSLQSQNVAITDVDGYNPHVSAMLDVNSTTRGFLLPRMTSTQMAAIATPSVGLMVLNTTDNSIYYYNGSAWVSMLALGVSTLRAPDGTPAQALTVDNNGRVGIGIASPLAMLHIGRYLTGPDSHIRLEYSATDFGNIFYDLEGMKFRTRTAGDHFIFQNSVGAYNMIVQDNGRVGIGTFPNGKLIVQADASITNDQPLFEVQDDDGQTIFAVYRQGVRMYVDEAAKGGKGGFAVGGRTPAKDLTSELMIVSPDSTRFYVNDVVNKGGKGGFAVGGRSPGKAALYNFVNLQKDNYFIGHDAGKNIQLGEYNLFLGFQAGYNTTGYHGDMDPTDGDNNIFMGYQAGFSNETGEQDVYIGAFSGFNANDIDNTFVGSQAGRYNTGYGNTFMGAFAGGGLYMVGGSGSKNTIIGSRAGDYIRTGSNNTFVGREAGDRTETGNNNVYIGHYTGGTNVSGSGNVFLGQMAGVNELGSNRLYIDNSGATSTGALVYGEFDNKLFRINGRIYSYNDVVTSDLIAVYGSHAVTPYYGIGVQGDGGYKGVVGNASVSGTGTRYGVVGNGWYGTSSNFGVYGYGYGGTTAYGVYGYAGGATTNWAGYFAGNVYTTGTYQSSDINLKKNIQTLGSALDQLKQIRGVSFEFKDDARLVSSQKSGNREGEKEVLPAFPKGKQYGVIAQEVELVFPEMVITDENGDKAVNYTALTPVLLEAIKEQQKQIEALTRRLDQLEKGPK